MRIEVLSQRVEGSGQTVDYIEHCRLRVLDPNSPQREPTDIAHTLRVTIRVDSYLEQCRLHVDRWSGDQWHEVARTRDVATPNKIGYGPDWSTMALSQKIRLFQADRRRLLQLAEEVL